MAEYLTAADAKIADITGRLEAAGWAVTMMSVQHDAEWEAGVIAVPARRVVTLVAARSGHPALTVMYRSVIDPCGGHPRTTRLLQATTGDRQLESERALNAALKIAEEER
jgi:hypothetical protein